jgi:hypothetical protein
LKFKECISPGIVHLPIGCEVTACRTVILLVVLYDCDTLMEDDRLRVS